MHFASWNTERESSRDKDDLRGFFHVDIGDWSLRKSESEVITWKGKENCLRTGYAELQAAHPSGFDQHFDMSLRIRKEVETGMYYMCGHKF